MVIWTPGLLYLNFSNIYIIDEGNSGKTSTRKFKPNGDWILARYVRGNNIIPRPQRSQVSILLWKFNLVYVIIHNYPRGPIPGYTLDIFLEV